MLGGLSDLAAMAGVKVGEGSPTEIYQNLLSSEAVLEPVIYAKYKTEEFPDSVNLIEYFELEPDGSLPISLEKRKLFLSLFEALKARMATDVERMTKILTIKVTMPEAKLSSEIVNNLANSLDKYVRTKRKSYASEQRLYIEKRLEQIQDSLTIAENKLKSFKEQNRMVMQSPDLILQQTRLTRTVEIMNAVFLEMSKQLEIAKIEEIKDAPVLNIKEFARDPIKKAGPKRLNSLIFIMFLVYFLSVYI